MQDFINPQSAQDVVEPLNRDITHSSAIDSKQFNTYWVQAGQVYTLLLSNQIKNRFLYASAHSLCSPQRGSPYQ